MKQEEKVDLNKLSEFLKQNQEIDFRTADLLHATKIDGYNWAGFEKGSEGESKGSEAEAEDEKNILFKGLKAYQRMLRIVPKGRKDIAQKLLEAGIESSLQIAGTPKKVFIRNNLKLFDDKDDAVARELAERVYRRAIAVRKVVALQYLARVQQGEPHARKTRFMR